MEKMIKSYGKEFMGITKMVDDYRTMVQNIGTASDMFKNELEDVINKCMFEPKKAARLAYLEGLKINTEEQKAEILKLREEQKAAEIVFIAPTLKDDIQSIIGEGYTLSRLKREKILKVNGKKNVLDMNYLPKTIQMLDDPMNNAGKEDISIPTSVFRMQILEDTADVTEEKMIILAFLSLCFDPYKKYYEVHHWRVYFKVVEKTNIIDSIKEENISSEDDLL